MVTHGRETVHVCDPAATRWRHVFVLCLQCNAVVAFVFSDLTAAGCRRLAVRTLVLSFVSTFFSPISLIVTTAS